MTSRKFSYSCSSENCGFQVNKEIAGKKIDEKLLHTLLTKRSTAAYTFVSKEKSKFKAKLILKDDKTIAFDFSSGITCPMCKKEDIRINKGGAFCDCGLKVFRTVAGHTLTDAELKRLVQRGRVDGITDFVGKTGNVFEASLVLENGKTTFVFPDRNGRKKT
jgi:DNA topoisomerase-3